MKRSLLTSVLVALFVTAGFSAVAADDERQGEREPGVAAPESPLAVVEAFHNALSTGNRASVESLLHPDVLIMESGHVERSRQEYASHHLPADLELMSAVRYEQKYQSGDTIGDLAWVASEARLTGESGGKPVNLVSTESLVLRKTAAGWKIVHVHWSSRNAK